MTNHKHYTYRVIWSEEDNEYVGLCAEFPSLSFLASDMTSALQGIVDLVGEIIIDMAQNNEIIPEPLTEQHYSGKFEVEVPPEQHRLLAIKAAEEGVSLSRYVREKLS